MLVQHCFYLINIKGHFLLQSFSAEPITEIRAEQPELARAPACVTNSGDRAGAFLFVENPVAFARSAFISMHQLLAGKSLLQVRGSIADFGVMQVRSWKNASGMVSLLSGALHKECTEMADPIVNKRYPELARIDADVGQDAMHSGAFCVAAEKFQDAINHLGKPQNAEESALRNTWGGELRKALDAARKNPDADDCHYSFGSWWKGW
jgi:hypothetical protein